MYNTQTFVDIDYLLNYFKLKLLQVIQDSRFLHFLFNLLIFFVLPNNFIVSGVCSSSLYPSFVLNSNLLLIILM